MLDGFGQLLLLVSVEAAGGIDKTPVRAMGNRKINFFLARGPGNDGCSHHLAQFDGGQSDAAGSAKNDKVFTWLQLGPVLQRVVRRTVGQDQRRAGGKVHVIGHGDALGRVGEHLFGHASPATGGNHPITDLWPLHTCTDSLDHAGNFRARGKGQGRLELVFVFNDENVGKIDAAGLDRDDNLTLAG